MTAVSATDLPRTKAIDDLLSRGISSSANPPVASSGGNPRPSTRIPAAASLEQDEFQFTFKNCVRRGDHVLCSGSVTNKAEKARNLGIYSGQGQTTAIDNEGNSYISQQVAIGQSNGTSQVQLMPELPMNFFLTFTAVEQSASTITIVLSYWGDGVNQNPTKALFRNVPLSAK